MAIQAGDQPAFSDELTRAEVCLIIIGLETKTISSEYPRSDDGPRSREMGGQTDQRRNSRPPADSLAIFSSISFFFSLVA